MKVALIIFGILTIISILGGATFGIVFFGIITVFLLILVISDSKGNKNVKNPKLKYDREFDEMNKIDDFFERCYNNDSRTFDFKYFTWNSEPFRDPDVRYNKNTYDWFLIKQCDAGIDFIFWINYFIYEGIKTKDYTYMLSQIRAREQMLNNIVFFCGGTKCPNCIKEYVSGVKGLLSGHIPCNEKNLRRILDLVPRGITSDSIIHNS